MDISLSLEVNDVIAECKHDPYLLATKLVRDKRSAGRKLAVAMGLIVLLILRLGIDWYFGL